jgi:anthranilate synthase/aminodeoxychorismate synthase-like glutamine amidotransferase
LLLLLDNHDSFTYNLAQYLAELGMEVSVALSDRITLARAQALEPSHLVISPGPGRPEGAGISIEAVRAFAGRIPVLGVCLGHQALAEAFGGRTVHAPYLVHGKARPVKHQGQGLFAGIVSPVLTGRYHSLMVEERSLPAELEVTARSPEGLVMGLQHRRWPLHGVQFHPESVLTEGGRRMLSNFLGAAAGGSGPGVIRSL